MAPRWLIHTYIDTKWTLDSARLTIHTITTNVYVKCLMKHCVIMSVNKN